MPRSCTSPLVLLHDAHVCNVISMFQASTAAKSLSHALCRPGAPVGHAASMRVPNPRVHDQWQRAATVSVATLAKCLQVADFKRCAERPAPILVGYAAQYCLKPALGFVIAKVLALPDALAVGLILVSCCPGGQASNVATFIAHGDVALSVLMTTASTIGAILMTPFLTKVLAGAHSVILGH